MKLVIIILLLATLNLGCDTSNPYNCSLDESMLAKNDSLINGPSFQEKHARLLKWIDEPSLKTQSSKVFRFSTSYPYDYGLGVYTFERTPNGGLLTIKQTFTDSYRENVNFAHDTLITKRLTQGQWETLEEHFHSNCFWTIPTLSNRRGLDGRNLVLEAYDPEAQNPINHIYHIAGRWSPPDSTEFGQISYYLEGFGGQEIWRDLEE